MHGRIILAARQRSFIHKNGNIDALRRLRDLRRKFQVLWQNYTLLADMIMSLGGIAVNEWPKGCMYWSHPK
eukprot:10533012-Prorocentrum_lima.AAC.1